MKIPFYYLIYSKHIMEITKMIKKILAITALLVFAYTNSSFDTDTTIIRMYEQDGYQFVDYVKNGNEYIGVYVEDL